jgi:hypothetical protein
MLVGIHIRTMGYCVCQLEYTTTRPMDGLLCMPIGIHNRSMDGMLCMPIDIHNMSIVCQWVVVYANCHTQHPIHCPPWLLCMPIGLLCMRIGIHNSPLAWPVVYANWVNVYANWHTQKPIGLVVVYAAMGCCSCRNGLLCMPIGLVSCVCQLPYMIAQLA